MIKTVVGLLLIGLFASCNGQQPASAIIDFKNPYSFNAQIENELKNDTTSLKYQFFSQAYAMKGDHYKALEHWDITMGTWEDDYTSAQTEALQENYTAKNAIDFLTEQAPLHQVIIINEAHHNAMHRVFTKSLLQKMYETGYTNIGFETLGNGKHIDSLLMQRKYPIQKSGFYTKEPQFRDLVRTALQIGFTVFPYEETDGFNGKPREMAQAKNIQKEIEKRPNEKFLIHCGFNHAYEGIHENWEKAMAARLAEYTGINPLTIDQVKFSEKGMPVFTHPMLSVFEVTEPSVLMDTAGNPMKVELKERWTDVAIIHPKTQDIHSRPNWLFRNGSKPVPIDLSAINIPFPIMILAFKKGEDLDTAIPMDIVEIETKTNTAHLALKKGACEVVVTNTAGNTIKRKLLVD